jgi:hypothetical protein
MRRHEAGSGKWEVGSRKREAGSGKLNFGFVLLASSLWLFSATGCQDTRSADPTVMRVEVAELRSDNIRLLTATAKRTVDLYDAAVAQKNTALTDKLRKYLVEDSNAINETLNSLGSSTITPDVDRSALTNLKQVQDAVGSRLHPAGK